MAASSIRCPFCNCRLRIKDEAAWKKRSLCPKCGTSFVPRHHAARPAPGVRNDTSALLGADHSASSSMFERLAEPEQSWVAPTPMPVLDRGRDSQILPRTRYLPSSPRRRRGQSRKRTQDLATAFSIGGATVAVGALLMLLAVLMRPGADAPDQLEAAKPPAEAAVETPSPPTSTAARDQSAGALPAVSVSRGRTPGR